MADLTTTYLGLKLKNPVIAGSSGLTNNLENIKKLEKHGAGAVVLKSVFEEQILFESKQAVQSEDLNLHPEAYDYLSGYTKEMSIFRYLDLIENTKKGVSIPVIASINCLSDLEWVPYAKKIEEAGADALELNIFIADFMKSSSSEIEKSYFRLIEKVKEKINIPIAVKLAPFFTNIPKTLINLSNTKISGLVLFNRFYNPDINLEKMAITPSNMFSSPSEISGVIRWLGLVSDMIYCDISATSGVHDGEGVVKLILVGATTVQICSALYKNGIEYLSTIINQLDTWLNSHSYKNLNEIRGKFVSKTFDERQQYSRYQYMKYYSGQE
jgi:dihydroorotate dehydrogenase (fumarate)